MNRINELDTSDASSEMRSIEEGFVKGESYMRKFKSAAKFFSFNRKKKEEKGYRLKDFDDVLILSEETLSLGYIRAHQDKLKKLEVTYLEDIFKKYFFMDKEHGSEIYSYTFKRDLEKFYILFENKEGWNEGKTFTEWLTDLGQVLDEHCRKEEIEKELKSKIVEEKKKLGIE